LEEVEDLRHLKPKQVAELKELLSRLPPEERNMVLLKWLRWLLQGVVGRRVKVLFILNIGGIMPVADAVTAFQGDTLDIKLQFRSARGHVVPAENIRGSVSDATALTLTQDPADPSHFTILLAGDPGFSGTFHVDADGHIGEGDVEISGDLPITIGVEDAVSIGFNVNVVSAPAPSSTPTTTP
jgi:hypothetical protein